MAPAFSSEHGSWGAASQPGTCLELDLPCAKIPVGAGTGLFLLHCWPDFESQDPFQGHSGFLRGLPMDCRAAGQGTGRSWGLVTWTAAFSES